MSRPVGTRQKAGDKEPLHVIQIDENGDPVSVSAAGDGAILDGASAAIRATVKDYANSNPLAVSIVDTNGDAASIGGGTQYTEDAAAPANPVGNALILVREDARAGSLTTADNDNVAARGNNKGEQYVIDTDANAKLTTITGHVDGIEGLLTTIDGDTGALVAQSLDYDTGGGTAAQVIIGIALPASGGPVAGGTTTNPIQIADAGGNISIDDGGNVITVDGTVAVTNAGLTELAAAINASSQMDVNIAASAISFGGTSAADDADFTDGTTPGTPAMGVYESTPSTVTDGDLGVVGITEARRLKTSATIDAALPAGTNNIGDVDVLSSALPTGASTAANQTTIIGHVDGIEALLTTIAGDTTDIETAVELIDDAIQVLGTDTYTETTSKGITIGAVRRDADTTLVGTTNEFAPLQVDANGRLKVEAFSGEALPVTLTSTTITAISAGNNNIGDVDVASIAAGDNNIGNVDIVTMPNVTLAAGTNTNEVVGDIAHDTGVSGNPVQIAGAAQNMDDTAPPNRVSAESDVTRFATDRDGALFVRPYGPQIWTYHVDGSSALTDTSVHAAPGSGLSLYVTDIIISLGAATALNVFFEEGSTKVLGPFYLEAVNGRGLHIRFATPKKITADTALTVTSSAAVAHSIDVQGFTAQG